ncbi:cyclase family protein [Ammoniphilus sp. YIM 78166]|uniref:cyclase family protein n=1 Tax=Ammoniphilus sp. YIM 78166 TaxID=1644106 RepID=UPI00107017A8|nr:cyclase family protein [Ammoniphilus sp. YIM 78166]
MLKRISYSMTDKAPGWPGNPTVKVEPHSLISEGEVANGFQVTFFNHFGSHMDGPKHFNDEGPRLPELPIENFFYKRPLLVDIPKGFKELVRADDLKSYEEQIRDADVLLIRSGFSTTRKEDADRYASEGPGVSAEACQYLIDEFPQLKAIGMDWISLASYAHLEDGILAHQYLLGKFHNRFICIIEDLNFEGLPAGRLKSMCSIPLFIEGIDSSPVTVVVEI